MENQLQFQKAVLLMPRLEDNSDGESTFAPAVLQRTQVSRSLNFNTPSHHAPYTLSKLGMTDLNKASSDPDDVGISGGFTQLNALGMTAAFFNREQDEANAINELADRYEFIPDFPLSIPSRPITQNALSTSNLPQALMELPWPEISGVSKAHSMGFKGNGVLVGVLDTGIDADHQEFVDKTITYRYVSLFPNSPYWPSRDIRGIDTGGHGTHVSGIIAGKNIGIVPEADLYVASVIESETTRTSLVRVTYGLDWLLRQFSRPENENRPAVINLSLGFPETTPEGLTEGEYQSRLRAMRILIRLLTQANVLPVVAIGNDGAGNFGYPGGFDNTLGVGAVDFNGNIADFSGSGDPPNSQGKPDLVGYGVNVYSSVERNYRGESIYKQLSGTSMASPYVAGIAALYRCQQPLLSVDEIKAKILSNALNFPNISASRIGVGLARFLP